MSCGEFRRVSVGSFGCTRPSAANIFGTIRRPRWLRSAVARSTGRVGFVRPWRDPRIGSANRVMKSRSPWLGLVIFARCSLRGGVGVQRGLLQQFIARGFSSHYREVGRSSDWEIWRFVPARRSLRAFKGNRFQELRRLLCSGPRLFSRKAFGQALQRFSDEWHTSEPTSTKRK